MKTPWHDKNGELKFPYRAILDRVFIWPCPPPERLGKKKLIYVPEEYQKYYQKGEGVLLSVGPGYWDDKGKWHPTSPDLRPGCLVSYDKTVPWGFFEDGLDGRQHYVVICGYRDLYGLLPDSDGDQ